MKKATFLRHYLPCIYFIILAIAIQIGGTSINYLGLSLFLLFGGLLFIKKDYLRMTVGGLTLFAAVYFSLALADEANDMISAGRDATTLVLVGGLFILGTFLMSILLIVPLNLPKRVPLYNRR